MSHNPRDLTTQEYDFITSLTNIFNGEYDRSRLLERMSCYYNIHLSRLKIETIHMYCNDRCFGFTDRSGTLKSLHFNLLPVRFITVNNNGKEWFISDDAEGEIDVGIVLSFKGTYLLLGQRSYHFFSDNKHKVFYLDSITSKINIYNRLDKYLFPLLDKNVVNEVMYICKKWMEVVKTDISTFNIFQVTKSGRLLIDEKNKRLMSESRLNFYQDKDDSFSSDDEDSMCRRENCIIS